MRLWAQSLASLSGLRIWRCRALWCRPAAIALIKSLAWEPSYAKDAALKKEKKKKGKKAKQRKRNCTDENGPTLDPTACQNPPCLHSGPQSILGGPAWSRSSCSSSLCFLSSHLQAHRLLRGGSDSSSPAAVINFASHRNDSGL